jgi:8-amino-7-oxononanoate synthase
MVENKYRHFLTSNRYPRRLIQYKSDDESAVHLTYEGKSILNFSSNDYLGLARHPLLITRSQEYAKKFGVGASSSRLVAGNLSIVHQLEEQLAHSLQKPAALILGSGYQTNFTVLEALLDKQVLGEQPLVFCDKFLHASMILSIRHHAQVKRFQHNDLTHLESLLIAHEKNKQPKFILVESLYSMDGDPVDLKRLISLAKQYEAMLYVDDAHCVGVYGPNGWGNAAEYSEDIDIIMGTFSKGLGSFGGYIACSNTIKEYLVNRCKGLIYSTALPAPVLGAISAALELVP